VFLRKAIRFIISSIRDGRRIETHCRSAALSGEESAVLRMRKANSSPINLGTRNKLVISRRKSVLLGHLLGLGLADLKPGLPQTGGFGRIHAGFHVGFFEEITPA
jgi:hypothetical protein